MGRARVKHLPKAAWALIVVLVVPLGAVAYLLFSVIMDAGSIGEDPTQVADMKSGSGRHHRSPSLSVVPLPRPRVW